MEDGPDICKIEATVATGFERCAKDEVLEKLNVECTTARGKVNFDIETSKVRQILSLQSVDNLYVVLQQWTNFQFTEQTEDTLNQFRDLIPQISWDQGFKVWKDIYNYEEPVLSQPTEGWQDRFASSAVKLKASFEAKKSGESGAMKDKISEDDKSDGQPSNETTENPSQSDTETQNSPGETDICDPPEEKSPKTESTSNSASSKIKFRATCYRTGKKHNFQSPEAACHFGGAVQDYFGWTVDLKNHDIEVVLNVVENHVYVMLALTRSSLHRRNISHFGRTTLRPTIAYNMLRLCQIKPGEVVCDPMCGSGTIPIEATINWPDAVHLCGDIDKQAWPKTKGNFLSINKARLEEGKKSLPVGVCSWDATNLPLKDKSVDVIITDLPFGKRSGSKLQNWQLYPAVLREFARVCRPDVGRACLLTHDKKCIERTLYSLRSLWTYRHCVGTNIGGLASLVYVLSRTSQVFQKVNRDNP